MQWQRLDRSTPVDGTTCVVGHFTPGCSKPAVGVWTYHYFGDKSYWQASNGDRIECFKYDNWCDVNDIISVVEDRIIDEIRSEIEKARALH